MAETEVKTKLTIDDAAVSTLQRIEREFGELDREVDDVKDNFSSFGTQFAATFAAVNLMPAIEQLADFTSSLITVGAAAFDVEQGIAGMMAGMTGEEWGVSRAYAEDLYDTFTDLSANIGQAKDDIIAGHKQLTTFLGGGAVAMKVASDNMSNLTAIANVQGHTVQELGAQFGKMAAGFVATESPLFNLLRGTGIFASDLTKVTQEWQKLSQEERLKRLEGAIGSIADNLSEAPPTLNDMLTSISAIGDEFMETFGKSAMSEFMEGLNEFRGDLLGARGDMKGFAQQMGHDVGRFVADAVRYMREAFAYVQTHAEDIRTAVKEGFQFAKDTVQWIIDNKSTLMVLGGLGLAMKTGVGRGAISGAAGFATGAVGAAASGIHGGRAFSTGASDIALSMSKMTRAMGPMAQVGARGAQAMTGLVGAVIAGGPPMWAATAAVTALAGGAIYLANKASEAEEQRQRTIDEGFKEYAEISKKWGRLTEEEIERMDNLRAAMERASADSDVPERLSEEFQKLDDARRNMQRMYINPLEAARGVAERFAAGAEGASDALIEEMARREQPLTEGVVTMFQRAWKAHDEGAMQYIVKTLGASSALRNMFFRSADMSAEGFAKMASVAEDMGEGFAEIANKFRGLQQFEMEQAVESTKPQINFNGGQVFKIQQEFREQDPDRIAIAFERRFTQAAISRVQASTTTPFGT